TRTVNHREPVPHGQEATVILPRRAVQVRCPGRNPGMVRLPRRPPLALVAPRVVRQVPQLTNPTGPGDLPTMLPGNLEEGEPIRVAERGKDTRLRVGGVPLVARCLDIHGNATAVIRRARHCSCRARDAAPGLTLPRPIVTIRAPGP